MCQFHSYLSLVESLEAVTDSKHFVAFSDSHPDSRAHGGVHTGCRCADVQHCNVKGALWVTESSSHTQSTLRHTPNTQRREQNVALVYSVRPYVITHRHTSGVSLTFSVQSQHVQYDAWFEEDGISATFRRQ